MGARILIRGGEEFYSPESVEDVSKRFRKNYTCPTFSKEGRTVHVVYHAVVMIAPFDGGSGFNCSN